MNDDSKLSSTDQLDDEDEEDTEDIEETEEIEDPEDIEDSDDAEDDEDIEEEREKADLGNRKIVITRPPHQAGELETLLVEAGAVPLLYPCIDIDLPEDLTELNKALQYLADGNYDWMLLTSANTARIIARQLAKLKLALSGIHLAVIGPKTAEAVEKLLGLEVDLVAQNYTAEGLARALQPVAGLRFLLPQSELARPVLAEALHDLGADVTTIVAYRTVLGKGGDDIPAMLARGEIHAITFSSSSTVRNFLTRMENEGGSLKDLQGVCLAAIGPITAQTMESLELPVTVTPDEFTISSLVTALDVYFRDGSEEEELSE